MRQAPQPPQPTSPIVRRATAGESLHEMLRRGEIGEQALGLIQMMAAQAESQPMDLGPGRAHFGLTPVESN